MPRRRSLTRAPWHAAILGLVQGPTEVLPVSSSAHLALLPLLAGWPRFHAENDLPTSTRSDAGADSELRNSLEVALHAGTAAGLSLALRSELLQSVRELDKAALGSAALALAPPALVGYLLEQHLERRPNGPRALATGLTLGAAALAWADTRPGTRRLVDLGPRDGFALGLAQALALLPGVSRHGAALTAARARGFVREDAHILSWRAGFPLIAGAAALKAARFGQRGAPPGAVPLLATGAAAAFASTLVCTPLLRPRARERALWPLALYRVGLALAAARSSCAARAGERSSEELSADEGPAQ
jgi:undecaprenyl-diphosphatase